MNTDGVVPFVFGCFDADSLPGPILVAALTDLGVTEANSRALIARMRRDGWLEATRAGRVTQYRLGPQLLTGYRRVRHGARPRPWTGAFASVVYDIPEAERRRRDDLRVTAFRHGFGAPRPGLLLGLDDPAPWLAPFAADHRDDLVVSGTFACEVPEARRLAESAWHLTEIADDTRRRVDLVATRLAQRADLTGAAAFQAFLEDFRVASDGQLRSPALPPELLPDDWPGDRLDAAARDVMTGYAPAVSDHLEAVVERVGHGDLVIHSRHD